MYITHTLTEKSGIARDKNNALKHILLINSIYFLYEVVPSEVSFKSPISPTLFMLSDIKRVHISSFIKTCQLVKESK